MVTIRAHHDADGITSAYFTAYAVKGAKIELWNGDFGDTKGLKSGDYMVDMRPLQNMKGLNVIDHHGPYPEDRKYELHTGHEPASYLCWQKFKEDIPKSDWWKLAIGVCGDGQPELIPAEVFEVTPGLLDDWKTSAGQYYGKWKVSYYPVYKMLSSHINALLRKSDFEKALNLIRFSESPKQILTSPEARKAKMEVKAEVERIIKGCKSVDYRNLAVFVFNSEFRVSGYIASVMQSALDKTIIAINGMTGRGSLRGDLALYYKKKLNTLDYMVVDGHPGFMGLSISVNPDVLIEDLEKIL